MVLKPFGIPLYLLFSSSHGPGSSLSLSQLSPPAIQKKRTLHCGQLFSVCDHFSTSVPPALSSLALTDFVLGIEGAQSRVLNSYKLQNSIVVGGKKLIFSEFSNGKNLRNPGSSSLILGCFKATSQKNIFPMKNRNSIWDRPFVLQALKWCPPNGLINHIHVYIYIIIHHMYIYIYISSSDDLNGS